MDGFDTISLESYTCDICNQDTGEDLIDCILNDRCLQVRENSVDGKEPYKRAHKDCLDKWKTVIQATLTARCPSPKRTWKDRIKDLLTRHEESNVNDTWLRVECSTPKTHATRVEDSKTRNSNSNQNNNKLSSRRRSFLTNEEYRIERSEDEVGSCEERARKLRVRSVDKEDEDFQVPKDVLRNEEYEDETDVFQTSWTVAQLDKMCTNEIEDIMAQIKRRIENVSTLLISELQEKDSLQQQADSLHTTAAQLVKLQQKQNIKTLSLDFEHQHGLVT